MNINGASQHAAVVAWDGTANAAIDTRKFVGVSFTFEVLADLVADTTFTMEAAPPSGADPCLPGTFAPVPEVLTCVGFNSGATPAAETTIRLPSGTPKGTLCSAAPPCKPGAFVRLVAGTGGTANVKAAAVLSGPM